MARSSTYTATAIVEFCELSNETFGVQVKIFIERDELISDTNVTPDQTRNKKITVKRDNLKHSVYAT